MLAMRRCLSPLLFITACAHGQTALPPSVATAHPLATTLDDVVPQMLAAYLVPGASIALIQRGEVVWAKGYGFGDVAARRPVTPQTVFNIGSISKTVAAWGVMRLVERKELALDEPALRRITRWHLPASEFDANGITVRRLLSHTAG